MTKTPERLSRLIAQLDAGELPSTDEILEYGEEADAVERLLRVAGEGTVERRRQSLPVIIDLGRPLYLVEEGLPEQPAPIVTEPLVVSYLVERLDDEDAEIRNLACTALVELVPGDALDPHSEAVLTAIEEHPTTDGAVVLLGKIATAGDGLALMEAVPDLLEGSDDDVIMARARLGDERAEDAILRSYQDAADAEEKGALALRLGYVGKGRSLELLAREIRSPDFYIWVMRSRRSLRVHIIEGLHLAFPAEPLFWKPLFRPSDDSYYEAIESWLSKRLGVTWDRPRPDFLYEEDAPVPR